MEPPGRTARPGEVCYPNTFRAAYSSRASHARQARMRAATKAAPRTNRLTLGTGGYFFRRAVIVERFAGFSSCFFFRAGDLTGFFFASGLRGFSCFFAFCFSFSSFAA